MGWPENLFFLVNGVDGQAGGEQEDGFFGRRFLVQGDDVIVGGGEQFFPNSGPFLSDGADDIFMCIQKPEVPTLPIALHHGHLLAGGIEDAERAAEGEQLALEPADDVATGVADVDFGAEQREAALDGKLQPGFVSGIGAFIDKQLGGQHLLVDEEPEHMNEGAGFLLSDAELGLGLGIQHIIGVGQLHKANVFADEVGFSI